MKMLIAMISVVALTACGAQADDNRDKLTKEQRAAISERTQSFGVVQLSVEPSEYFTGPYEIAGGTVQVAQAESDLPGKAKYAVCAACHGAQGQGGVGPMLAGKDAEYIVGRLNAYRNGEQVGAQSALMWGQAAGLSDVDIQDLSEYISSF